MSRAIEACVVSSVDNNGPDLIGGSGMGTEIGAGLSVGEPTPSL
jgi:hypothetical protein